MGPRLLNKVEKKEKHNNSVALPPNLVYLLLESYQFKGNFGQHFSTALLQEINNRATSIFNTMCNN